MTPMQRAWCIYWAWGRTAWSPNKFRTALLVSWMIQRKGAD